jgi:kynurenine 3-monooxygenase
VSGTTFDTLVAADGAFSVVRQAMQRRRGFDFVQEHCRHSNVELTIPANAGWDGDGHASHIWPRKDVKLIGFPNPDGSFSLSFHPPSHGAHSAAALFAAGRSRDYFALHFPDVAPRVPGLEQIGARATEPMVSIRCAPWFLGGCVCLVGDAAHALFPFAAGQGANSAFEDGLVMNALLDETGDDFEAAYRAFYHARKPALDALCELTRCGYHKDGISFAIAGGDPVRARLRADLRRAYPALGHSLYANIAFTHHPYDRVIAAEAAVERAIGGLLEADGYTNPLFARGAVTAGTG